jgi:hypothetical protein
MRTYFLAELEDIYSRADTETDFSYVTKKIMDGKGCALYIGQLAAQRRLDILPGRGGIVLCRVGAEVDGEGVLLPCVCYRVWYNQAAGGDGWART